MRGSSGVLLVAALICGGVQTGGARVLLYPTALSRSVNLMEGLTWFPPTLNSEKECVAEETRGGPFSQNDHAWRIEFAPQSAYWRSYPTVEKGHVYLVGAWVRYSNAKVLIWSYGTQAEDGKLSDQRIYSFGGFNDYLLPYLSEKSLKKLGGDPAAWKLVYRVLEFPEALKDNRLCVGIGLYASTGAMVFSSPFLIDVTEEKDRSLTIDIADVVNPIRSLKVLHTELKDTIWTKSFDAPIREYKASLPVITDFMRGFDQNKVFGHSLEVVHEDGVRQVVYAPHENVFQNR